MTSANDSKSTKLDYDKLTKQQQLCLHSMSAESTRVCYWLSTHGAMSVRKLMEPDYANVCKTFLVSHCRCKVDDKSTALWDVITISTKLTASAKKVTQINWVLDLTDFGRLYADWHPREYPKTDDEARQSLTRLFHRKFGAFFSPLDDSLHVTLANFQTLWSEYAHKATCLIAGTGCWRVTSPTFYSTVMSCVNRPQLHAHPSLPTYSTDSIVVQHCAQRLFAFDSKQPIPVVPTDNVWVLHHPVYCEGLLGLAEQGHSYCARPSHLRYGSPSENGLDRHRVSRFINDDKTVEFLQRSHQLLNDYYQHVTSLSIEPSDQKSTPSLSATIVTKPTVSPTIVDSSPVIAKGLTGVAPLSPVIAKGLTGVAPLSPVIAKGLTGVAPLSPVVHVTKTMAATAPERKFAILTTTSVTTQLTGIIPSTTLLTTPATTAAITPPTSATVSETASVTDVTATTSAITAATTTAITKTVAATATAATK